MGRVISIVLPPPRRRPTWRSATPLAAFLVGFALLCLVLEFRRIVVFTSPNAFWLLAVLPWVWWVSLSSLGGLGRTRALVALLVRFCLIGVFVMLLAEPRSVRRSEHLSVVYALDLSDSIGEQASDSALKYILETVHAKPGRDEAGLVVFGRDAAVELPPRTSFPYEAVNVRIARDGTNIEKALSLAGAMLPAENAGRVVLISDGTHTEGSTARALDELKARDVPVDVVGIQYDYLDEVWLEKLELPRFVKLGETYEAAVVLSSLREGTGRLTLRENGEVVYTDEVEFRAGKNRFTLPLYRRQPGYYLYVATVETPRGRDGRTENNTAVNHLYLKGEGRTLVVTDPDGDAREWERLVAALKAAERHVDVVEAYEFSSDALSLMPYDCILFVNVPADAFDAAQLVAVRDAVYNQGVGFLMVGGRNSYGPGGFHRTPVEEALPVTMDVSQKKVMPKSALVIVLHTCEFAEGNTWGKRIAKEAIRVLGSEDEVGVLVWGMTGEAWLFPLTPAREYERLVLLINKAEIGDMPSFGTTMEMGLAGLKASTASTRHMIIISDGDPQPPTPKLLKDFVAEKISVSTVSINPHGGVDIQIMRTIASVTGGRYYAPQTPETLPSIFIKEAKTLRRSMIQNKIFTPVVSGPSDVLKGIETIPELRGYVLTTPKPRSNTVLKGPETEDVDPVLALWRFGLGKTAAFTSDLSPNWAAAWIDWDKYQPFVKQLVTDISRTDIQSDLTVQTFAEGNRGVIVVEDHHRDETFLEVTAEVTGEGRRLEGVRVMQVAPRRYRGEFPLWGRGRYQVVVSGTGGGRGERSVGGFVVPYSPEYLRFRSNPLALKEIAERTGGRVLSGDPKADEVFVRERTPRTSSRPVFDWFLVAIAFLVPLDVASRRVQLDWALIRGWLLLGRRRTSEKTLGALLERKKKIEFVTGPAAVAKPLGPVTSPTGKAETETVAREAKPEPEKKPLEDTESMSTTERLLARKRRWKKKDE